HHRAIVFAQGATPRGWPFQIDGKVHLVRRTPHLVVNSTEVTVAAAVAGRGLTMALSYQVMRELCDGRLVRVLEPFETEEVPIHVIHGEGRRAPARVRAFAKFAAERLRADPSLRLELLPRSFTRPT